MQTVANERYVPPTAERDAVAVEDRGRGIIKTDDDIIGIGPTAAHTTLVTKQPRGTRRPQAVETIQC